MHELLHICCYHAGYVWVRFSDHRRFDIADFYGRMEPPSTNILVPHLLIDPEQDRGLDQDFLTEAVARFEEDESIQEVLVGAVEEMSRQLSRKTMNDDYKPYVLVRYFSLLGL